MIYFKIIIELIAIMIGVLEIYDKKIKKQDYKIENLLLLSIIIAYSQTSELEMIHNLAFIIVIIIIFIMLDVVVNKIRNKAQSK